MKRMETRKLGRSQGPVFIGFVWILTGISGLAIPLVLRKGTSRKALPRLPRRLKIFSLALASAAFFVPGASGQFAQGTTTSDRPPAEPLSPYARTGFAFGVDRRGGVLVGWVNARGSSTTASFQLGRTKSYGRWFPPGPPEHYYSGYHPSELETGVDGLRPGTTYHFRLVATNAGGKTYGKDKTFTTLPR